MRIVALHTDFRLYWPARLDALKKHFDAKGDTFQVVEIAGKGSPYAFAQTNRANSDGYWNILYPESAMENLDPKEIKPRLMKLLDKLNPDIIISGAIAFPSGAVAVAWANKHDKRVIVFDDSKIDVTPRSKLVNRIKRAVYNGVDAMLYPAPQWDDTGRFWGFDNDRIFYGIDVVDNAFWEIPSERVYGRRYFLTVGRLIECKNFDGLIRVYNKLAEKFDDIPDLVIIGEGPQQKKLKELACDKVNILPFKKPEELRSFYQHAELFILPSHQDTWGLVVNEAMAAGLGCAVSRQCGCAESLIARSTNYMFNDTDYERLLDIMIQQVNLSPADKEIQKNKIADTIKVFDMKSLCKAVEQAVDKVYAKPKRRGSFIDKLIINRWNGRYNPV